MKAEIQSNGTLKISVDHTERLFLSSLPDEQIHQDEVMYNFLEPLVCNSEFCWVDPSDCGDLTSAPMLGILSIGDTSNGYRENELPKERFGQFLTGGDEGGSYFEAITGRWAFMDYQVRSVLEDLREKGEAIFVS